MVVAAAAAARTAGRAVGDKKIKQIQYTGDKTIVCLNSKLGGITKEQVTIGVNIGAGMTVLPAEDFEDETCTTVTADKPTNNSDVAYTFLARVDLSTEPSTIAKRRFTFVGLEDREQIECGTRRNFKISSGNCTGNDGGVSAGEKCYMKDDHPQPADGCQGENLEEFKYCQLDAVHQYTQQGEPLEAESLAYSGKLTLTVDDSRTGDEDVYAIVVNDGNGIFEVVLLENGGSSVMLEGIATPSSATYTACPVENNFTAYEITDLDVKGTYEDDSTTYFQFGFSLPDKTHTIYQAVAEPAASGAGVPITIDCSAVAAANGTRCYGYAPGGADSVLHLSYFDGDGPEKHNTIVVTTIDSSSK